MGTKQQTTKQSSNLLSFKSLKELFLKDYENIKPYWKNVKKYNKYYSGNIWEDVNDDKPRVNLNQIAGTVNAILGSQLSSPIEAIAVPRQPEHNEQADNLNAIVSWFRSSANALDEESQAYKDACISGIGYVETNIDFTADPYGTPDITYLDNLSMIYDCKARKSNLTDANHMWHITYHTEEELSDLFPDKDLYDLKTGWLDIKYPDNTYPLLELRIKVKDKPYYKASNGLNYDKKDLIPLDNGKPLESIKLYTYRVKKLFIANDIITEEYCLSQYPSLGWQAITYDYDPSTKQFYGITKGMMDAQQIINRMISQQIYQYDRAGKGNIIIEQDAVEDIRQFENDWAKSGKVLKVKPNKMMSVKPLQPQELSQSSFEILNQARNSLTSITGISQEFIGTREVQQAGILEQTRRQSTINVLMSFYSHLNYYRKLQFKDILYLTHKYFLKSDLSKAINKNIESVSASFKLDDLDFNVILTNEPVSNDAKVDTLNVLKETLPMLTQLSSAGADNSLISEILKYTPLPYTLTNKLNDGLYKSTEYTNLNDVIQNGLGMLNNNVPIELIEMSVKASNLSEENKTNILNILNNNLTNNNMTQTNGTN